MKLILKKTWEMIFRGKTIKPLPVPLLDIKRKNALKLLGVTFNEHPCNWETHFDQMITKASSRLYFLRVCKFYKCSSQELTFPFDCLLMSVFVFVVGLWIVEQ